MNGHKKKIAVLLLNLGGPDSLEAVKPFLFNLFSDPAIIGLPNPFRFLLASLIAKLRAVKARNIYAKMGGKSPILKNTQAQAKALEALLGEEVIVLPVMRYWHPRAKACVEEIMTHSIDQVVILPLYPHYSTTTTESSYLEVKQALAYAGFNGKVSFICCYPLHDGWLRAIEKLIKETLTRIPSHSSYKMIFTAHGLPEKVIKKGDPYQHQVEMTTQGIIQALNKPELNWSLAYQSRVGPLKWIGPTTEDEIIKAGAERLGVIMVPLAFVSEHSETLVELDIDYSALAKEAGVPFYYRVPTVSVHPDFIQGLAELVTYALRTDEPVCCPLSGKCESRFKKCGGRFA